MCANTERAELLLPGTPAAAHQARAFARTSICTAHAVDMLDDAVLLISELVTNAVRHARPPILLSMDCLGDGLSVRIRDGAEQLPQQRHPSDVDEGGRGLLLLDAMSHAWGVERVEDEHGTGKAVWFELRPPGCVGGTVRPPAQRPAPPPAQRPAPA